LDVADLLRQKLCLIFIWKKNIIRNKKELWKLVEVQLVPDMTGKSQYAFLNVLVHLSELIVFSRKK
jgi:hypothetical protein